MATKITWRMAAVYGKVDSFTEGEDWGQYIERLDNYFDANEIADAAKQRAVLLSVCGATVYKLMRDLAAPRLPKELSYASLVKLVKTHFNPEPSVIISRFKFNSRIRKTDETVADYTAELRHLTEHCKFGATLSEMLRDRLVCGINNEPIQRRLLSEKELTYDKALEIALSMEAAATNVSHRNL